jgi:hypothetical protein
MSQIRAPASLLIPITGNQTVLFWVFSNDVILTQFREIGQEIHKPKQRAQRHTYRERQQVDLDFEVSHPPCVDLIIVYNQIICINCMVRTQLYIFTQNSTLGIQLHVSVLCIGRRQFVL